MIFDNFEHFDSHQRLWVQISTFHYFLCDFDDFNFTTLSSCECFSGGRRSWITKPITKNKWMHWETRQERCSPKFVNHPCLLFLSYCCRLTMVTVRSWTTWGNRSTTEEEVVGNIRYVPLIFKCHRLKTLETKVHPRDVYLAKLWTICFRAWMRQSPQLQSQYLGPWKISKSFTFQDFSLIINIEKTRWSSRLFQECEGVQVAGFCLGGKSGKHRRWCRQSGDNHWQNQWQMI